MTNHFMWIAVMLSISGNIGVVRRQQWGFILWIIANIMWIIDSIRLDALPQAALFTIYLILATWGAWAWKSHINSPNKEDS